jgi:TRAP-type mannitol/chloroaromatic compound transport system permease small subunit
MIHYLYSVALQSSVLGDLKAERGGESMWSIPLGIIVGIVFLYLLIKGMYKSED